MRRISFYVIDVDEGKILIKKTNGKLYECWTISYEFDDMFYQFGCPACDFNNYEEFADFVMRNYENGNLCFQGDDEFIDWYAQRM